MKISKFLLFANLGLFSQMSWSLTNSLGDDWFKPFQWDAFVSQSVIYTNDNNYLSRSDDRLSFDMWEAGLLFTTKVKGDLSFSAQLLGRRVSEFSDEDIRIDYGFFSYPVYHAQDYSIGVRIGRIRSSYGFYNETRDIPHTRTGIVMPQALYYDMTRNSFYSADGIELYGFQDVGENRLAFQLFLNQPITDHDESQGLYPFLNVAEMEGDKGILAKVSYGSELEGWRTAFTYYRPDYDAEVTIDVGVPPFVVVLNDDSASFYSENMVTSVEYNELNWSLTGEYSRHKFHTNIPVLNTIPLLPVSASRDIYEEAYYIQGVYRFSERWESYLRIERAEVRNMSDARTFHKDTNVGLAYRPDDSWLIRAEAHYIEGMARLFARDNDFNSAGSYWNALLFQVAYKW